MYHNTRLMTCGVLLALVMAACSSPSPTSPPPTPTATPQPPRVEEITFQSGEFTLFGDLRTPAGTGPFPVILFVHGSGPADRTGNMGYPPIMERMLQAGFATFAWDKPGTGESTPKLNEGDPNLRHKRAQILLDAIELMKSRPDIDPTRIGVLGASQAGYVIPIALTQTEDIAFVICVSCAGESGHDEMGYQLMALGLCQDMPKEKSAERDRLLKELDQNRSYQTYAGYQAYRKTMADLAALVPVSLDNWPVTSEEVWQANPIEDDGVWNPVPVFSQIKIPVLAIFGDQDRLGDFLQGAYAYRKALGEAGNPKSRVEVFPNANHEIFTSKTGCPDDDLKTMKRWFQWFAITHGLTSQEKIMAYLSEDPYKPGLLDSIPFAPGFLDLIEEWLRGLRDSR
jgi:pimeloyl-ACP methyl ester carboxylesterase